MASKKSPQRNVSKSKVGGKRPEVLLDESIIASVPGTEASKASRATLKKPRVDEQQAEVVASTEGAQAEVVDLSDVVPLVADVALAPVPAATSLESLLVQVATADAKSDKDSGVSPWWLVAGGAGIAALAAGGGGGGDSSPATPPPAAPPAPQGFVVDALVKNVVVFRDSDGDGMWKDVNGDGVWQQGDEFITVTNENGSFDNLAGTGGFVAASLRVLMSTNGLTGDARTTVQLTTDSVITGSNGERITGEAIDTGTNQPFTGFFVADDIKLAGVAGSSVYITGISTLVAQMLAGVASPATTDLLAAAQKVAELLGVPFTGTFDSADAIALFTGDVNTELASVLASVAASARAVDLGMTEQEAVFSFLEKLGEAAVAGGISEMDQLRPLDLTSQADLAVVFNEVLLEVVDAAAAQSLADTFAESAIGAPAAAQQSAYVIAPFSGDRVTEILSEDITVGHLSVLAAAESTDVSLFTSEDVTVQVVSGSNLRVEASGFSAEADLTLGNVVGGVGNITVQATGSESSIDFEVYVDTVSGDIDVVAAGFDAYVDAYVSASALTGNISVTSEGQSSFVTTGIDAASVSAEVLAEATSADARVNLDLNVGENLDGSLTLAATGDNAYAFASVDVDGSVSGDVTVEALAPDAYASLSMDVGGNLVGNVSVEAAGDNADASLDLNISGDLTGNLTVTASDLSADTSADVSGDVFFKVQGSEAEADVFVMGALSGDIMVLAEGVSSFASLDLGVGGNIEGNLTVEASGEDSAASMEVDVGGALSGDVTVTAAAEDAFASLDLSISGDLTGNLVVEAKDASADTVVDSSADFSIDFINGAEVDANVFVGGLLSGDVDVVAEGVSAEASLDLNVVGSADGNVTVEASGQGSVASVEIDIGASLSGDVTVTASGDSSDVYLSMDVGGNLDGKLTVEATGEDAFVSVDVDVDGALRGDVTVTAAAEDALASLDLYVSGDLTGNLLVKAKDASTDTVVGNEVALPAIDISMDVADGADAQADVYVGGSLSGDLDVLAEGVSAQASLDIFVSGDITGNVTVEASGENSMVSVEIDTNGSLRGDVTVTASGEDSFASLDLYVSGDVDGLVTVEATGEGSVASVEIDIGASLSGDVTVKASDVDSDVVASVEVGGNLDGNVTVTASGQDAYVSLDLFVAGSADGNVTVEATGEGSTASVEIDVIGSLEGDVTVTASSADAFASLDMYVSGDVTGAVTVEATAENAFASIDLTVGGDLIGGITVDATAGGVAEASVDIAGDIDGDLVVHAVGEGSVADLSLSYSGNLGGMIDIKAEDGGKVYLHDGEGNVLLNKALSGDVAVQVSGDGTEVHLALTLTSSDVDGMVLASADDGASVADLRLEVNGQVQGGVAAVAQGDGAQAMLMLDVIGELVDRPGIRDGSTILVLDGGSIEGNVTAQASGSASSAQVQVSTSGDIDGNVTVLAEGLATGEVVAVPAERRARFEFSADSMDFNIADRDIDSILKPVFNRAQELNTSIGAMVSVDNPGYARASVSLDIAGDVNGEVVVAAVSDRASARLLGDVAGNLDRGLIVDGSGDRSAVYISLDVDGDIDVVEGTDTAVYVFADGEDATVAVSLDVLRDIAGNLEVGVDGEGALAVVAVEVDGDIEGDVLITVSAEGGAAYVSLDVGNSIDGSIDIRVEAAQAVADVFVDLSNGAGLQGTVTLDVSEASGTARFGIDQSVQSGSVTLQGQGRYEVRMVGGSDLDRIDINTSGLVDLVLDGGDNVSSDLITDVNGFDGDTDLIRALIDPTDPSVDVYVAFGNVAPVISGDVTADELLAAAVFSSDFDASFYVTEVSNDTYVVYDADGDGEADGILRLVNTSSSDLTPSNFLHQQNLDIQGQGDASGFNQVVNQPAPVFWPTNAAFITAVPQPESGFADTIQPAGVLVADDTAQYGETVNLGRVVVSNAELASVGDMLGDPALLDNTVNFNIELLEGGRLGDVSVLAVDHVERTGLEEVNVSIDGTTDNAAGTLFRQSNVNVQAQGGANATLEVTQVGGSIASITVGATAAAAGITRTAGDARLTLKEAGGSLGLVNMLGQAPGLVLGDIEVGVLQGVTGAEYALVVEDSLLYLTGDITVQAGGADTVATVDLSTSSDQGLDQPGGNLVSGTVGDVVVQAQDGGVATLTLGLTGPFGLSSVESLRVSAGTAPAVGEGDEPVEVQAAAVPAETASALADALVITDELGTAFVEAFDNATAHLNLTVGGKTSVTADVLVTGGVDENGVDDQAAVELQFMQNLSEPVAQIVPSTDGWWSQAELSLSVLVSDLDRGIEAVDGQYQMSLVDLDMVGTSELSFGFIGGETMQGSYGSGDTFMSIDDFLTAADDGLDGMVKMFTGQVGEDWYVALDEDGMGVSALVTISSLQVWSPMPDSVTN